MKRLRDIKKSRIAAVVLAIAAAVVIISSIGYTKHYAFLMPVNLERPTVADSNGDTTAIVDSESRRILVLNKDMQLVNTIMYNALKAPIDAITDINVSSGKIYVAGVTFKKDSNVIEKEKVLMYDAGGKSESTVFEIPGSDSTVQTIKSLSNAPRGTVVATLEEPGSSEEDISNAGAKLTFHYIDSGGATVSSQPVKVDNGFEIYGVFADAISGEYTTLSYRGQIFDHVILDGKEVDVDITRGINEGHIFKNIAPMEGKGVYANDDLSGAIYLLKGSGKIEKVIEGAYADSLRVNGNRIVTSNQYQNLVVIADPEGRILHSIENVSLSLPVVLDVVLFDLAAIYLAVFLIVVVVKTMRKSIREKGISSLAPLLGSVAVVLTIGLAIGYSSFTVYKSSLQTRINEINTFSEYTQTTSPDFSKSMEKLTDRKVFIADNESSEKAFAGLIEIQSRMTALTEAATNNNIGLYFNIYAKDDNGVFCVYDSSREHVMGTRSSSIDNRKDIEAAFAGSTEVRDFEEEIQRGSLLRDTSLFRIAKIPTSDGKGTAGVIEIGSRMRSFETTLASSLAQNIITLIVISLVVYLAYIELRKCAHCIARFRQFREKRQKDAVAVLTRPFTFMVTMLTSLDGVMTVLIAKQLIDSAGMGDREILLAIPAAMLGIGLALGQLLYGKASAHTSIRRLTVIGAGVMLVFAVGTAVVVGIGNFWLYCLAKLLMSVPFGMLYSLGYSLPRKAESAEVKADAASGVSHTDTSAAALGTVIGGFVAQALGNQWVYVIIALATLPVIFMALGMFPKTREPIEALHERGKGMIRLFLNPRILALAVLVMLPAFIAAGYNSFIFPLFASDSGIQIASTNYLFVIGQLVVYVSIVMIGKVRSSFGNRRVMVAALVLLGVVFLLFSINTTVVWSVVVIALVGLLGKTVDTWKAVWIDTAQRAGFPAGEATGAMFATRSIILVVQPFVLAGLLYANDSLTVIGIGLLCVIAAGAYYLIIRKIDPATEKQG